jgi:hypothetical protein
VEALVDVSALIVWAARAVGTGLAGAVAYDGVKRVTNTTVARNATVTVASWGLRGVRAAETGAERTRLAVGDIMSEARQRIGEQAPPPGTTVSHEHEH